MKKRAQFIVHTGTMCAGKSLYLIEDYQRAVQVGEFCRCYVPHDHKDGAFISSRLMGEGAGVKIPAKKVKNPIEILDDMLKHIKETHDFCHANGIVPGRLRMNVYIDEMNLFPEGIIYTAGSLAYNGIRTVGAMLDLDYRGEGFPLEGEKNLRATDILGIATEVIHHYARCAYLLKDGAPCGERASRTQRFRDIEHKEPSHYTDPTREIDPRKYIPVCEEHHEVPGKYADVQTTAAGLENVINGTDRFQSGGK